MDGQRKEYSEDDSFDRSKTSAEYGNEPAKMGSDNTGNTDFSKLDHDAANTTTGGGYSQAERNFQDGTNNEAAHHGNDELVEKYNINDKAHSDSSIDDFVPTTSAFRQADQNESETPGTL